MIETTADISTQQKILDAAKTVFMQRSFDGTRMEDIAKEAGINKALLHYYFQTKEKLFEKIFDSHAAQFFPNIVAVMEKEGTIYDKIEVFVHSYIEFFIKNPQLPLFVLTEINKNPERLIAILNNTDVFPKMQQFIGQLMMEVQLGKVKPINPVHFFLNMMSLCLFPFVAKLMIKNMIKLTEEDYDAILQQRKQEVTRFIFDAIKPSSSLRIYSNRV